MANNVKEAEKLIAQAKDKLAQLFPSPSTTSLAMQVDYTVGLIERAKTGGSR